MGVEVSSGSRRSLGLFALVMIAIVSVDSLRNLPVAAQYGFSLITFYAFAGLTFFLPLAWITSKLAAKYPSTGGSFVWISQAFGNRYGHLAMLIQWLYNIIWYPTIFAFITATFATLFVPNMESNRQFILIASLIMFWSLSIMHCRGIRASSWFSSVSAIIGTLLPMTVMIILAGYWLWSGNHSATPLNWNALIPKARDFSNIGFFSNVLFSLIGLEVIAMHAGNVKNPAKTYSRAVYISFFAILLTVVFSSSALCVIMPVEQLTLVTGLSDVLRIFFEAHAITNISLIIGFCIILGGLGIAGSWMVGLARGLHVSMCAMNAPQWLQTLNKNHMPTGILFLQAVVFTILMCAFLFFPDINSSYWMLSAITAQFGLLYYILLFCAAVKLIRHDELSPINKALCYFLPGVAILVCILGIIAGFVPPEISNSETQLTFQLILVAFFAVLGLLPFTKYLAKRKQAT